MVVPSAIKSEADAGACAPAADLPERRAGANHGHGHGGHGHGGHGHGLGPGAADSRRALIGALVLTASFMGVEVAVGFYSGSLALVADAAHMLADAGALGLALLAQGFASRPRTHKTTFGSRRAEVLAAFVNGIALGVMAIWIVAEAIERWMQPRDIIAVPMLITACVGLAVNLGSAAILNQSSKHSVNARAAFLHVLMDALGSVAAIAAALCIVLFGWERADPVLSVGIALLVAYSGWAVLKETARILLEGAPEDLDVPQIAAAISECPGVASLHDLHVWRISDRFDAVTVHVVLQRGAHGVEVCREVSQRLHDAFGLEHVTVQPEAPPPDAVVPLRLSRDGEPSQSSS